MDTGTPSLVATRSIHDAVDRLHGILDLGEHGAPSIVSVDARLKQLCHKLIAFWAAFQLRPNEQPVLTPNKRVRPMPNMLSCLTDHEAFQRKLERMAMFNAIAGNKLQLKPGARHTLLQRQRSIREQL
ncbi:MAG TPA: hypothetical protein DGG94_03080 [Micromonosporaceae bacterium]|nr:hypothetical protein [Micromonosporaceae bacterium]HCU48799.1 hypothetical protein [Micromonosporaceae bacterium]